RAPGRCRRCRRQKRRVPREAHAAPQIPLHRRPRGQPRRLPRPAALGRALALVSRVGYSPHTRGPSGMGGSMLRRTAIAAPAVLLSRIGPAHAVTQPGSPKESGGTTFQFDVGAGRFSLRPYEAGSKALKNLPAHVKATLRFEKAYRSLMWASTLGFWICDAE